MSIKSDRWIRKMATEKKMIEPFEPNQVKSVNGEKIVSYGTSSYGYDVRCSNEFKVFTNIFLRNFDNCLIVKIEGIRQTVWKDPKLINF